MLSLCIIHFVYREVEAQRMQPSILYPKTYTEKEYNDSKLVKHHRCFSVRVRITKRLTTSFFRLEFLDYVKVVLSRKWTFMNYWYFFFSLFSFRGVSCTQSSLCITRLWVNSQRFMTLFYIQPKRWYNLLRTFIYAGFYMNL